MDAFLIRHENLDYEKDINSYTKEDNVYSYSQILEMYHNKTLPDNPFTWSPYKRTLACDWTPDDISNFERGMDILYKQDFSFQKLNRYVRI